MLKGIFENCVLASDIDGTLLDNGFCATENITAIEQFISDGGKFLLCTGRSITALNMVKKALGFLPESLVCNGGILYNYEQEKMIFQNSLADEDKAFFKKVISNFPDVGIEIHSETDIYELRSTKEAEAHAVYEELDTYNAEFEDIKDKPWNKTVIFLDDSEHPEKIINIAENYDFKDSQLYRTSCVIDGIRRAYLEVYPKSVSKASGLAKLREIYGVDKGNLFAIGDYYNDVPMLEYADISAVTGNSPDDIKALADYITVNCRDGAVADFIKYLYKLRKGANNG